MIFFNFKKFLQGIFCFFIFEPNLSHNILMNWIRKRNSFLQFSSIQHYLKYNCIISRRKCNGKEWASNYLTLKVKMWHCGIFKIAFCFFENVRHNDMTRRWGESISWFWLVMGIWCQKILHPCISYCIDKLLSNNTLKF